MLNIGPQELIVVLLIALVVVGPKRLPELGRSIGRALSEFRKVQDDVRDTLRFDMNDLSRSSDEPSGRVTPHPSPEADRPETDASPTIANERGDQATDGDPRPLPSE